MGERSLHTEPGTITTGEWMTRRLKARVDANQSAIVEMLRNMGCVIQHLHTVGNGVPDLVVGVHGALAWCEIKDGAKKPSAQRLTEMEEQFRQRWQGYPVFTVASEADAMYMIEMMRRWTA